MIAYSSIFGNALVICGAAIGVVQSVVWLRQAKFTKRQQRMILAWVILLADFALGRLYWIVARLLAPEGQTYHVGMLHHGYLASLVGGIIFVIALVLFTTNIKQLSHRQTALLYTAIFGTSAIATIIAH